ncbi:MAG: hypothetical protein VKP63_01515 [Cyanobacteriota bacterium]|nr:hypothetical protein [Cyanobacteriota bacterium]
MAALPIRAVTLAPALLAPALPVFIPPAPLLAQPAPLPARVAERDRYDRAILVCRSIDPTNTLLNLRAQPRGRILGTLSRQSVVYVRGQDWRHPIRGYVPIRFYLEARPASAGEDVVGTAATAPAGWVWQAYLTCELVT